MQEKNITGCKRKRKLANMKILIFNHQLLEYVLKTRS